MLFLYAYAWIQSLAMTTFMHISYWPVRINFMSKRTITNCCLMGGFSNPTTYAYIIDFYKIP